MGIRIALGASRRALYKFVLFEGVRISAVGVLAGVGLSAFSLRALRGFVFEISVLDPAVVAAAGVVAGSAALAACALPAWHAGRVQPTEVLAE